MGGGAWPFLVGGVICLVKSDNERDLSLLNSYAELDLRVFLFADNFLEGLFASYSESGSFRQKQVCDALRCSGLHAHYTDVRNELSLPDGVFG